MHPFAASPARPSEDEYDLLPVWTDDDLHDDDLDLLLGDRLAESAFALRAAAVAAGQPLLGGPDYRLAR